MERYRSVGVATIASLMSMNRADAARAAASNARDHQTVATAGPDWPAWECTLGSDRDLSEIGGRCEREVVTAYRDFRASGADDVPAFKGCMTL